MARIDFYCPACGETTKQNIDYFAPGMDNFICDNCFSVFDIEIKYYDITPSTNGKLSKQHHLIKYIKSIWKR